jgi:Family of unknown function (DUF5372)
VTHPFVPQRGQEYEAIDRRVSWGEQRLYYYDAGGFLRYIPESWTDLALPEPLVVLGAGRAHFRIDDLLRLVALIEDLTGEKGGRAC